MRWIGFWALVLGIVVSAAGHALRSPPAMYSTSAGAKSRLRRQPTGTRGRGKTGSPLWVAARVPNSARALEFGRKSASVSRRAVAFSREQ
jgi:hypothetical protein